MEVVEEEEEEEEEAVEEAICTNVIFATQPTVTPATSNNIC